MINTILWFPAVLDIAEMSQNVHSICNQYYFTDNFVWGNSRDIPYLYLYVSRIGGTHGYNYSIG